MELGHGLRGGSYSYVLLRILPEQSKEPYILGWFSKLGSLWGVLVIRVPRHKRDPNIENYPLVRLRKTKIRARFRV